MIKKLITIALVAVFCLALLGATDCAGNEHNKQIDDNVKLFDEAIIQLPNGEVIQGNVELWRDFADGDQLQIRIDGVWYLVHSTDAVLIAYSYETP